MKHYNYILITLCILGLLMFSQQTQATHLYSAEITYRCLGNNQFIIEAETFQDCGAVPPTTSLTINMASTSCGINQNIGLPQISLTDITPFCPSGQSPCATGGYGSYRIVYADTVSLSACSDWIFSYTNCCKNPNILNLVNSNSTTYIYTSLDNSNQCNNAAKVTGTGYLYAFQGQTQSYYCNAFDLDGDSLVFSLSNPLSANGVSLPYALGYSVNNPLSMNSPTSFNSQTGKLTFTPNIQGSFFVGIQVEEYRNGVLIATANKDIHVVVLPNLPIPNNNPDFEVNNVQGGYLEQNIFYVTNPQQLSFDIIATDTTHATDTLTFSSTINTIGGAFTSTGTNPAVASFTWSTTVPTIQEFTVSIVDNHCSPIASGSQYFGFAIVYEDQCTPDSVQAIVAVDSVLSICTYSPNSSINTVSPTTSTYGTLSIDSSQHLLIYTAGSNAQVQEAFWAYLSLNNGAPIDSVWIDVTTTSCVWAGDADTNTIVNHFDLLPLGLGYGETGPVRPNAGIDYDCEAALDFVNSTPSTNINYKHSDTNGDGIVDANDTMAIVLNWGQVHLKNGSSAPSTGIPFYVEPTTGLAGQTLQIPIILGDSTVPADSIYGLAFTINYDASLTDTNSVSVDFNSSWLGSINTDMIAVQKDFYYQGKIDVGLVRIDQTTRSGMGKIGDLTLTIKDDILKKSAVRRLDLLISDVRLIDHMEIEKLVSTPPTDVLVTISTNTKQVAPKDIYVHVFPNPTKGNLQIESNDSIEQLNLYSLTGQLLQSQAIQASNHQLNLTGLENGLYLLHVQTTQGSYTQKIQIYR